MLTILDRPTSLCDGFSRREAMRIGGLSAMGLSLPQLLHDQTGRPFPLSRGQVIREIVG